MALKPRSNLYGKDMMTAIFSLLKNIFEVFSFRVSFLMSFKGEIA